METLTNVILALAFIGVALFVGFYAAGRVWYTTAQGIVMMTQSILWLLLITHYLALSLWDDYPGHDVVKNVLIVLIMLTFWVTFFNLRLAQTAHKPISKRRGAGFVPPEDVETTLQTRTRKSHP